MWYEEHEGQITVGKCQQFPNLSYKQEAREHKMYDKLLVGHGWPRGRKREEMGENIDTDTEVFLQMDL